MKKRDESVFGIEPDTSPEASGENGRCTGRSDKDKAGQELKSSSIKDAHAAGIGSLGRSDDQIGFEKGEAPVKKPEGGDQY